jgi:hypothetical protein
MQFSGFLPRRSGYGLSWDCASPHQPGNSLLIQHMVVRGRVNRAIPYARGVPKTDISIEIILSRGRISQISMKTR